MFDFEESMNARDGASLKNTTVCLNSHVLHISSLQFFFAIIISLGGFDIKKHTRTLHLLVKVAIIAL